MADHTKIEWTDATANVVNGCSLASPGCTNCYAMRLAGTRMKNHPTRAGLTMDSKAGPVWTGEVRFNEKALLQVLAWTKPRMIFWNAHGDLFHENVPDEWIDRCFAVMALTPHHIHQVLTKRAKRMREYLTGKDVPARVIAEVEAIKPSNLWNGSVYDATTRLALRYPLPNVWLGVSVEDQTRADERIPDLLATPAAVRWLSCEPLLGPVDLTIYHAAKERLVEALTGDWQDRTVQQADGSFIGVDSHYGSGPKIDWIVAGGESGPGARPMHPDWARSLRDQGAAAGVPFFFKQWGDWLPVKYFDGWEDDFDYRFQDGSERTLYEENQRAEVSEFDGQEFARIGKKDAGRLLDGCQHDGMPEVAHG